MLSRTKVIAVAAATAAIAAGSVGAAMASTTGAKPSAKHVSANAKGVPDGGLAAQLGVSQARLDHAMREVKTSLVRAGGKSTEGKFEAMLARLLGIPERSLLAFRFYSTNPSVCVGNVTFGESKNLNFAMQA